MHFDVTTAVRSELNTSIWLHAKKTILKCITNALAWSNTDLYVFIF